MDFDSVRGAQVPFSIQCTAAENLGSNTFYDATSGGDYERISHLDSSSICLETNTYHHDPENLSIDITLNITNDAGMLYDPQGYVNETLNLTITHK